MPDIGQWLEQRGLGKYSELLAENEVDFEVLLELEEADLEKIGLALGPRKKLLKAIRELDRSQVAIWAQEPAPRPLPSGEAERRQLTVMFADLVGSTELAQELDPEELRGIILAYQDAATAAIERFGGYVARYMGDGLLAYFGYPQAHEDDAERAVRSGLELIDSVFELDTGTELAVRVGIATGAVVVGDLIGAGAAQESAVVGETPNLAARLQGIAEPNSVVLADSTRRLVEGRFELQNLGPHSLKGIQDPVAAYRPIEVRDTSRFEAASERGLTPLTGREEELGVLWRLWELAKAGEGQVILLSGEPGIGKSRLAAALQEQIRGESHRVLRYQCSPYHLNSAFFPVIEQLERVAGFARDDDPGAKLDKLEALLEESLGDGSYHVPLIAALLSLPLDRYPPIEMTPQKQKSDTIAMLVGRLDGMSRCAPLMVLLEDAHWIDPSTLELFDGIMDAAQRLSLLVLITHRPDFDVPWRGHEHVTQHSLNRLGRRDGSAIIERLTGNKKLPEEVKEQIVVKTDGIPLFVEELTKTVLESGLLEERDDHYALTGPLPLHAVPSTLQDSLMARLDRLAPAKEVAQVGAILGREFSYELLAGLLPIGDIALQDALGQLGEAGLVSRQGVPPDATYTFKHPLVQDTAYNSLLLSRRQVLHARTGELLETLRPSTVETEPELLARHYTEAGLFETALPYWQQAGERCSSRSAHAEAANHFMRGLDILSSEHGEGDHLRSALGLQIGLADALVWSKGFAAPEVESAYGRARELCQKMEDVPELFGILWGLWHFFVTRGDLGKGRELAEELCDLAKVSGSLSHQSHAHRALGEALLWRGEFQASRVETDRGLAVYDPEQDSRIPGAEDPAVANRAFNAVALWCLGYPDQALRKASEGLQLCEAAIHAGDTLMALDFVVAVHVLRQEAEAAQHWSEEELSLSTKRGMSFFEVTARIYKASASALATEGGGEERALEIARCLETYRVFGAGIQKAWFLSMLAQAHLQTGRPNDALDALEKAFSHVAESNDRWWLADLYRLKAESLIRMNDPVVAEESLDQAIRVARTQQAKSLELRACTSLARLWCDQGKHQQAHDVLAPIYSWFTEGFDTADLVAAKTLFHELS